MKPRSRALPALLAAFCAAVWSQAIPVGAQDASQGGFSHVAGFDHIQTDDVKYNLNTGDFTLKDRFTATRQGTDITADSGSGNSKKKVLHAQGHVVVHQTKPIDSKGGTTGSVTQQPSTLTCDKLDVDGTSKLYQANGNVHLSQEGREAYADNGTLDETTSNLHLEGHVRIRDKEQYLEGDVVDYNTATGEMTAKGAPVTIRTPIETPGPAPAPTPRPKKK
jgi:lipopolysaccharide export system protein LptA